MWVIAKTVGVKKSEFAQILWTEALIGKLACRQRVLVGAIPVGLTHGTRGALIA